MRRSSCGSKRHVWLTSPRSQAAIGRFATRGSRRSRPGSRSTYARAAAFDDVLTVWVRCSEIRGARFSYEYVVERDGDVVATATTHHATVDRETHAPTRVPAWFVDLILKAEGRSPGSP